jgi:hypothetical protein
MPASSRCEACERPLDGTCYVVAGALVCAPCGRDAGSTPLGVGRHALALGSAIAAAGAVLLAVSLVPPDPRELLELSSLIGGPAGVLVGAAVGRATRHRGGLGWRIVAVTLTYLVTALAFVHALANADPPEVPLTTVAWRLLTDFPPAFLALPLLQAVFAIGSIVGGLSLGGGLYAAWRLTGGDRIAIDGPFEASIAPAAPGLAG